MNVFHKQIKFERIRQQFGCGYYAVCCRKKCPCDLKKVECYDPDTYNKMMIEFQKEEEELFGT